MKTKKEKQPVLCVCGCGQYFIPKDSRSKCIKGHLLPEAKQKRIERLRALNRSKKKPEPKPEDFPYCACGCGERVKNINAKYIKGHGARDPEIKKRTLENMQKTMLEKYGTTNASHIAGVTEKRKQTCLEKYGVDNPSKSKEIIQRITDTIQDRYGVAWATQKSDYKEKVHQTSLEKYGVDHYTQSQEIKDKIKQSNLEKYGTEYYQQCSESKEHYKQLSLEKYGTEYSFQSEEVKQKIKNTLLERYGVDNAMKEQQFVDKLKQTNLERFGVEWSRQNADIIQKGKITCLEKYGVDNPSKSNIVIAKIKQTFIDKYGVDNIIHHPDYKQKAIEHTRELQWNILLKNLDNKWTPLFTREEFIEKGWLDYNTEEYYQYQFKCNKCGEIKTFRYPIPICRKCNPIVTGRSGEEKEVEKFIQDLGFKTLHSVRNILDDNKELDIYIPELKLAIEYDGLYWHSISNVDSLYHFNKTNNCNKKGIHLIHIFENEWLHNQDIVKSRIMNLLGVYTKTIYARKCIVKVIKNKSEYIDFLNINHLQGGIGCKYALGLYYGEELVSVMTFGSYRISNGLRPTENEYEMYRYCNKLGYHIPGAASKLFKYFIDTYNPNQIITYADRRWSNGNLYYKLGFNLESISNPNYWYIDSSYSNIEYRFKYRKSELPKLLENFDPNQTEQQNMLNNGFDIIYDCGNFVFKWKK